MFNLDEIVADYIDSCDGWPTLTRSAGRNVDWGGDLLHATDLTKCQRQVAMRLRKDTPEPYPPQKIRQFWAANQQHELIYASLKYRGILVAAEVPVPMPDGWSGTADLIINDYHNEYDGKQHFHVSDSKNPHPNTVAYFKDYPKFDDIFQVSVYTYWINQRGKSGLGDFWLPLENEGEVFYMPLGGAGEYKPTRFPVLNGPAYILPRMGMLEVVRDSLPTIPDVLPLEVRWARKGEGSSRRMNKNISGGDIVLGLNWQCGYCRYDCPNRKLKAKLLAKVSTAGGKQTINLTSKGRKYEGEIYTFLEEDAQS